jgi:hypothetical protein
MARSPNQRLKPSDLACHTVTLVAPPGVVQPDETVIATHIPAFIRVLDFASQPIEGLAQGGIKTQTFYHVALQSRRVIETTLPTPDMVIHEECHTQRQFQILSVVPSDYGDALDLRCVTGG